MTSHVRHSNYEYVTVSMNTSQWRTRSEYHYAGIRHVTHTKWISHASYHTYEYFMSQDAAHTSQYIQQRDFAHSNASYHSRGWVMSQGTAQLARLLTLNSCFYFEIPSLLWWLFIFGAKCLLAPYGANTLCPASYQTFRYFADANESHHSRGWVMSQSPAQLVRSSCTTYIVSFIGLFGKRDLYF